MAKGDNWQIGVWHPIPNPHFDKSDRCISKLGADVVSGNIIQLASSYFFWEHLQLGDVVKLGASSYAGYKGAVEYGRIIQKLTSPDRLQFSETLQNKYKANDQLIAWGTAMPSGAVHTQSGTKWTSLGIVNNGLDYLFGSSYALGLTHGGSADVGEITLSSGQRLLSATKYYLSVIYKSGVITATAQIKFTNSVTDLIILSLTSGQSSWTQLSGSGISPTGLISYLGNGIVSIYKTSAAGTVAGLYLKTIVLMHSADTSQESSGVVTLSVKPGASPSIRLNSGSKDVTTIDDEIIVFNDSVANNTKLEINAQFSKVDQTTYSDLQRLEEWQNKGNLLCLNANLFDIPKWHIGKMEIRNITRDEETKLLSLSLIFEELV